MSDFFLARVVVFWVLWSLLFWFCFLSDRVGIVVFGDFGFSDFRCFGVSGWDYVAWCISRRRFVVVVFVGFV